MSEGEKNSATIIYGELRLKTFPVPYQNFQPEFPDAHKKIGKEVGGF